MKFLIDMNLPTRWIPYLAAAGFEAVHWSQIGSKTAPDEMIMARAQEDDYVVLTRDLDFGTILFVTKASRPSVVQIRSKAARPEIIGEVVVSALRQAEDALEEGALLTVDPKHSRLRLMPLDSRK